MHNIFFFYVSFNQASHSNTLNPINSNPNTLQLDYDVIIDKNQKEIGKIKFAVQVRLRNNFTTLMDTDVLKDILESYFHAKVLAATSEDEGSWIGRILAIIVGVLTGTFVLFCAIKRLIAVRKSAEEKLVLSRFPLYDQMSPEIIVSDKGL